MAVGKLFTSLLAFQQARKPHSYHPEAFWMKFGFGSSHTLVAFLLELLLWV